MRCAVNKCGNNNHYSNRSKWRYFHFPRETTLLKKFVDFCDRDNINLEQDFERNMQKSSKLKTDSYPTGNRSQTLTKEVIKTCTNVSSSRDFQKTSEYPPLLQEKAHSPIQEAYKVVEAVEGCDILADSLDQSSSSNKENTEGILTYNFIILSGCITTKSSIII